MVQISTLLVLASCCHATIAREAQKPLVSTQPESSVSPPTGQVGFLPQQRFIYTSRNATGSEPSLPSSHVVGSGYSAHDLSWAGRDDKIASLHGNILLNGDFATRDTSGWMVESPARDDLWDATVESTDAGIKSAQNEKARQTWLRVSVPSDSYVMMFEDVDWNVTASYETPGGKDENTLTTKTTTIPFQMGDSYTLTFDYHFMNSTDDQEEQQCAKGSSLYYGIVSADDLIEIEGDIDSTGTETSTTDRHQQHRSGSRGKTANEVGSGENGNGWKTFREEFRPSTEWGSLYLYFMTKERGGCVFEVADIGIWRVAK